MNLQELISVSIFPNSFILNTKIPSTAKLLFQVLCAYDNDNNRHKGWVEASLEQIETDMNLSKPQVQNLLKQLVNLGLITIVYRNNRTAVGPRTSIYILNVLPGISEEDRQHIQKNCNLEIKTALSGLNNVKVRTHKGIEYLPPEEFDLEFLITGKHSSEIIEAELEESEVKVSKITNGVSIPVVTSSGRKVKGRTLVKKSPEQLAEYFGEQYQQCYGTEQKVKGKANIAVFVALQNEFSDEFICRLISFYIWNYDKSFYTRDYPKPRIYSLNQDWIIAKIIDNIELEDKQIKSKEVVTVVDDEPEENLLEALLR